MRKLQQGLLALVLAASVAGVSAQKPPVPALPQTGAAQQRPAKPPTPTQAATAAQDVKPQDVPQAPKPIGIVRGRVLAASGVPIVRARVTLAAATPTKAPCAQSTAPLDCSRIALTDNDGNFEIVKLPADIPFTVTAVASGFAAGSFGQATADAPATPLALHLDQAELTALKEPLIANVNITLQPEFKICGTVRDEDGTLFAGAHVLAMKFVAANGPATPVEVADAASDDRGEFHLTGLTSGRYLVSASDPAFDNVSDGDGPLEYPPTFLPSTLSQDRATVITVDATHPSRTDAAITLKLVPLARGGNSAFASITWTGGLAAGIGVVALCALVLSGAAGKPRTQSGRLRAALACTALAAVVAATAAQSPPPKTPPASQKGQKPVAAVRPAAPAVVQPARGVIAGRITSVNDALPVARARVTLTSATGLLPRNRVALTDADGRFAFDRLPVGDGFVLTASKSGFGARAYGETPPAQLPVAISLLLDQRMTADIALMSEVVVTGRILDERTGTPLEGALVDGERVFIEEGGLRLPEPVSEALTDETGTYRLHGLPPGRYFISAFDPAFVLVGDSVGPLFYSPTFYPGEVIMDDAVPIVLDPERADTQAIDFRVQIVRPVRVTGTIESSTGDKLTAGTVIMSPRRTNQISTLSTTSVDIKVNQTFEFANIQPDKYRIVARGVVERKGVTLFGQYSKDIDGGPDTTVGTMTMSKGAVVIGQVHYDPHSHVPPHDRAIRVRAPGADGSKYGDTASNIEDNGSFLLNGVMAGLHYIRIDNLPEPWRLSKVYLGGSDVTDLAYAFNYEDVLSGITLEVTDLSATIKGTLQVTRRDVLPSFVVIAIPANELLRYPGSRYLKLVRPDKNARFTLTGLPQGDYILVATRDADEGDLDDSKALERLASLTGVTRVRAAEGQNLSITLTEAHARR